MENRDTALYRLELKVPTASQGYHGRGVIAASLEVVEGLDWSLVDAPLAERWGGHADERVSTRFFEVLAALPDDVREDVIDARIHPAIRSMAIRARTDAVQEHVIWTPLLDRIAMIPLGRQAIPDFHDRLQSIHEWVRTQQSAVTVTPLFRFRCQEVVNIAVRNLRGLTEAAVKAMASEPTVILRLVQENLYLRPDDGRLLWDWLDREIVPGMTHTTLRTLEELVSRRLAPMPAIRRALMRHWTAGDESVVRALIPMTTAEHWEWTPEEIQLLVDRLVRLGDPVAVATMLDGGLVVDHDHLARLAVAFPVATVLDRLGPEYANILEAPTEAS